MDTACAEFGSAVEAALSEVEGKTKKEIQTKSERILRKWLDLPQRYRDPVRAGKVQLPAETEG